MVVGHHLVWTVYGWWLPNDPRGSSSQEIRVEPIAELGAIHYGRKAVQPSSEELRAFYEQARQVMAHAILTFTEQDIAILAGSIAQTIQQRRYTCYACAIMPEHVHLLIRRHRDKDEQMLEAFQVESRAALIAADRRRGNHPVWGGPGWKVFKSSQQEMRSTVRYIENNPRANANSLVSTGISFNPTTAGCPAARSHPERLAACRFAFAFALPSLTRVEDEVNEIHGRHPDPVQSAQHYPGWPEEAEHPAHLRR
jgi:REP element-mobilizing transposase RayT